MKKTTKIIAAVSAVLAVSAFIGHRLCKFALRSDYKKGLGCESGKKIDIEKSDCGADINDMHVRQQKYAEWFLPRSEDIYIMNDDGTVVHSHFLKAAESSHRYVIVMHGYKSAGSEMGYSAKHFYELGYNVIAPDGRSRGKTDGKFIGMGWLERKDIAAAARFISARDNAAEIVLYGVSMGAAAVLMATAEKLPDNVKCVIEDSSFTSVWDEFSIQIKSIFRLPVFPLLHIASAVSKLEAGYSFREASAIRAVKKCALPILFIHGKDDTFIPFSMLDELYNAASCEKEKLEIDGANHVQGDWVAPELYWGTIDRFLEKHIL